MNLNEALQSRLKSLHQQRAQLVEAWSPYINAVEAYLKEKQNRTLTQFDKHNMAVCLENATVNAALQNKGQLFEATTETDVASNN